MQHLCVALRNITADFISQHLAIISLLFPMRDTIDSTVHKVLKFVNCLVIVVGAVERDDWLAVCIEVVDCNSINFQNAVFSSVIKQIPHRCRTHRKAPLPVCILP